jgi:hypothetical protein
VSQLQSSKNNLNSKLLCSRFNKSSLTQLLPLGIPALLIAVLSGCSGSPVSTNNGPAKETSPPSPTATQPSPENNSSKTTQEVEQAIANDLPKEIGVPIKSVDCPNQKKLVPDQVFDCKAAIEPGSFLVRVTVKDAKGHLNFKTKRLLVLSEAEKLLQQSIKKSQNIEVKADCGDKVRLFKKVGDRFDCKLSNPSGKIGTATITVVNEEGKVDAKWKL